MYMWVHISCRSYINNKCHKKHPNNGNIHVNVKEDTTQNLDPFIHKWQNANPRFSKYNSTMYRSSKWQKFIKLRMRKTVTILHWNCKTSFRISSIITTVKCTQITDRQSVRFCPSQTASRRSETWSSTYKVWTICVSKEVHLCCRELTRNCQQNVCEPTKLSQTLTGGR